MVSLCVDNGGSYQSGSACVLTMGEVISQGQFVC